MANDYTWKELAQMLMAETNPQTNYHGSGRLFNRFENSYINPKSSAHGVGHYSADTPLTAGRYVVQNGKPLFVNGQDIPIKTLNEYWALPESTSVKSPYLYRVDVPNEYFMLDESKTLSQQSPYVKRAVQNIMRDIPSRKFYVNDPEFSIRFLKENNYSGRTFYETLADLLGRQNKNIDGSWATINHSRLNHGNVRASALLHKYGIQGIKGAGLEDGLLNVTFSGNNIRMANNPLQRIVNRIPTQTIGMIGSKIMATPGVQPTLKFLGRTAVPLAILEGLTSPVSNDIEGMNNYNAVRGLPLQGGIKYYGD